MYVLGTSATKSMTKHTTSMMSGAPHAYKEYMRNFLRSRSFTDPRIDRTPLKQDNKTLR
jgi:hypothetical protein